MIDDDDIGKGWLREVGRLVAISVVLLVIGCVLVITFFERQP